MSDQFRRHVDSPSRHSPQYSDASQELVDLFSRKSSQQTDSRKTSRSTVIGDFRPIRDGNRNAVSDNDWTRPPRQFDSYRNPKLHSDREFYNYDESQRNSAIRLGFESRRSSQNISDFSPRGSRDYRNSRDY
ncbi:unnamed protein product, partial [Strongylus vulgaris]